MRAPLWCNKLSIVVRCEMSPSLLSLCTAQGRWGHYTSGAVSDPAPTEIKLRSRSRLLSVAFDDGRTFELPFEFLRVHSPSAEVKGHGPGQEVLVLGKENVGIRKVEQVGQYAVKLVFDDGHDTGLFSWKYLYELGRDQERKWASYLERKHQAAQPR
jgi:DUF971 family protein